jgi:hypothetical protein
MLHVTEKTIKRLAGNLFTYPIEDYLSSENFLIYCRKYDLVDNWKEYLVVSRDRPDLYGGSVIKNAFVLFLHHIFHSRPKEFLEVFTWFLMEFSEGISQSLPLDNLKKDLLSLGFSAEDIHNEFSKVKIKW